MVLSTVTIYIRDLSNTFLMLSVGSSVISPSVNIYISHTSLLLYQKSGIESSAWASSVPPPGFCSPTIIESIFVKLLSLTKTQLEFQYMR